jgi:5S rRNA maturation endonuclease (ribonuclease M5)
MSISQEILEEIKQIPPEKVLNYLQIPYKQVGNQIMAQATWRDEKEASVSIQYKDGKWLWHDFGTGEGGDWIDLYRRYTGSDFKEAVATLMELANVPYSPNISTREPKIGRKKKTSSLSLAEFEELERIPLREFEKPPRDLERYLEEKGFLPYWEQIKEIPELYYLRYRRGNKEYSGLATRTTAGTWIIKNRYGTYVSRQPSGISIWNRDTSRIVIVEGFTDAMSLSLYPRFNNFTILILNGLGNLDKAIEILKILSPDELYIALDLDEKGLEGRKRLKGEFPEAQQVYFYGKDPAEHLERGMELPPLLSNELKRKDFKTLREYLNSNVLNSALNEFPEFKEAFEHAARWDPATYELYLRWLEEKPYGIYNKERERAVWMIDKVFEKHSKLEPKEFVKTVYLEIWKSALMDKLYPSGSYIDYERVERYADELLREIGFSGLVEKIKRVAWEKYEREIYPQIMKQYRSLEREREQGIDNSFSGPGLGG